MPREAQLRPWPTFCLAPRYESQVCGEFAVWHKTRAIFAAHGMDAPRIPFLAGADEGMPMLSTGLPGVPCRPRRCQLDQRAHAHGAQSVCLTAQHRRLARHGGPVPPGAARAGGPWRPGAHRVGWGEGRAGGQALHCAAPHCACVLVAAMPCHAMRGHVGVPSWHVVAWRGSIITHKVLRQLRSSEWLCDLWLRPTLRRCGRHACGMHRKSAHAIWRLCP